MDIGLLSEEPSVEQARELLIAISYSLPDKTPNSVGSPTSNYSNEAVVSHWGSVEELRSELISISGLQSPKSVLLSAMGASDSAEELRSELISMSGHQSPKPVLLSAMGTDDRLL